MTATKLTQDELKHIASTGDERVRRVDTRAGAVWVKRAASKPVAVWHYVQAAIAAVLPGEIYRPAPAEHGYAASRGEAARIRAFQAKGLLTPDILYQDAGVMILTDAGPTVWQQMAEARDAGDIDRHDQLLTIFAQGIGSIAATGLAHGRPHPRDCFLRDGRLGFMDLEQNPLANMRPENAQARDALFAFGFVCDTALKPETPATAFRAWQSSAPAAAVNALRRVMAQIRPFSRLAQRVPAGLAGADLRRFTASTTFLGKAFDAGLPAIEPPAASKMKPSDRV